MKIGMNMLLWTGHVTEDHIPILERLKHIGFDGAEIPVFDVSDAAHYRKLGKALDDIGLQRTVVAIIPDEGSSPISPNDVHRQAGKDHLRRAVDCAHSLGGTVLAGPWFQPLGVFSGDRPSEAELERCAEVHREIVPLARAAGMTCALEPLNRFEAYLLNTCEQAIDYADRIGTEGFGILFDTFHANIEEKNPVAALETLHASGWLTHVHISENDRGTPGQGHAPLRDTITALRRLNYDGWLTIEAFGRGVPELAAATRVWRDFFESPNEVCSLGFDYIQSCLKECQ